MIRDGQVRLEEHERRQVDPTFCQELIDPGELPHETRRAHALVRHILAVAHSGDTETESGTAGLFAVEPAFVKLAQVKQQLRLDSTTVLVQLAQLRFEPIGRYFRQGTESALDTCVLADHVESITLGYLCSEDPASPHVALGNDDAANAHEQAHTKVQLKPRIGLFWRSRNVERGSAMIPVK